MLRIVQEVGVNWGSFKIFTARLLRKFFWYFFLFDIAFKFVASFAVVCLFIVLNATKEV